MRLRHALRIVAVVVPLLSPLWAQDRPTIASVRDLELNPRILDGQLVRIGGRLGIGWEGDNFLCDLPSAADHKKPGAPPAAVWFYVKSGYEERVWAAIKPFSGYVNGTLTGYFHYIPNKKYRKQELFDPGPLQLEVIAVSDVEKEHR